MTIFNDETSQETRTGKDYLNTVLPRDKRNAETGERNAVVGGGELTDSVQFQEIGKKHFHSNFKI